MMKRMCVPTHELFVFLCFSRLQYFARGLQVYIRQLRVALQGKTGDSLKTDEVNGVLESAFNVLHLRSNSVCLGVISSGDN